MISVFYPFAEESQAEMLLCRYGTTAQTVGLTCVEGVGSNGEVPYIVHRLV